MPSVDSYSKIISLALIATLGMVGYAYWETLSGMMEIWWRSDTYAHGLIVPFISVWLIWQKRKLICAMVPQPTLWPLPIVAVFVLCWLLGELTAVNALTQFSLIAIAVFSILALLGSAMGKELAFPLAFLFFAVPIGDFLLPQLMEWTADFTVAALRLSSIPVYREGQSFVIPSGRWSVVEACSGIRYLIASVTVGTLYAYLTYTSLKRRLIFVAVSFLLPIVANWLRAYLIVMLGHLSGNKLAVGVDHLIYGWVFFGIVIAIMFAVGMRWSEAPAHLPSSSDSASKVVAIERHHRWPVVVAMLLLILVAGPIAKQYMHKPSGRSIPELAPNTLDSAWQPAPPLSQWKPRYINPVSEYQGSFGKGRQNVGVYIAYYREQDNGRKLIASTNVLVMSSDLEWQQISTDKTDINLNGRIQEVRTAELLKLASDTNEHFIAWRWYWISGQVTGSEIVAKWLTALSILSGNGDDGAAIVIYAEKSQSSESLHNFVQEMAPYLHRALEETSRK